MSKLYQQWLVSTRWCPSSIAEVGEHKYYFTRVYGGYIELVIVVNYKPKFTISLGGHHLAMVCYIYSYSMI